MWAGSAVDFDEETVPYNRARPVPAGSFFARHRQEPFFSEKLMSSVANFPPCRSNDLFHPLEDCPVALRRNPADEAYWLKWTHSFGGEATIRIARLGTDAMVTSVHRPTHFGKTRTRSARVALIRGCEESATRTVN